MLDSMSPYLTPSVVIGLGEWGSAVAMGVAAALKDRSPGLARACAVLALGTAPADEPTLTARVRAALKASRLAEVIRALEVEGLMQLDPEVAPATHVYLVASVADDPDLAQLRQAAEVAEEAAAELKAAVVRAALVDLADGGGLPASVPGVALYVVESVTSRGLVLDPAEFQAAVVEALVAAAQPGGSAILAGPGASLTPRQGTRPGGGPAGGGSVGTLGIAWLGWSPAALRAGLARRLSREALQLCLPGASPGPAAPALAAATVRQTEAWQAQSPEHRAAALLEGLPFRAGPGGVVEPLPGLLGPGAGRGALSPTRLRRAAAVLDRRAERWGSRLERNAAAQHQKESAALERTVQAQLAAGPEGPVRARALLTALSAERTIQPEPPPAAPRLGPALQRFQQAEALPDRTNAALALGGGLLLFTLVWWLLDGSWAIWITAIPLTGLVVAAYLQVWRPWRLRQEAETLHKALTERATALAWQLFAAARDPLDAQLETRCATLAADLEAMAAGLRQALTTVGDAPPGGALCFPLAGEGAEERLYAEVRHLAPDVAAHLGAQGCFAHWREPQRLLSEAEEATVAFLALRLAMDPGALAARAYGDRLGVRLDEAVRGLLSWSQPLLARPFALPEGRRWLLWPDGLPCPPVPSDVQVLPFARGCAAAVTVVQGLQAGICRNRERKTGETSA